MKKPRCCSFTAMFTESSFLTGSPGVAHDPPASTAGEEAGLFATGSPSRWAYLSIGICSTSVPPLIRLSSTASSLWALRHSCMYQNSEAPPPLGESSHLTTFSKLPPGSCQ
eukprot:scaffold1282_cov251-Pinguiococcus_pyrenoidosus.AAC.7